MTSKIDYLKDELVEQWLEDNTFSENTVRNYLRGLKHYCELNEMHPTALIEEAESDLKSDKLPRQYKIKSRLAQFTKEMAKKSDNTQSIYVTAVKSFYRHFEIPLPLNGKSRKKQTLLKNDWCGFGKDVVRKCLTHLSSRNRAILLTIVSSGLARAEILNLKLSDIGDVDEKGITTLKLQRQKSNVKFTTFLSQEATEAIQEYLKDRKARAAKLNIKDDCPYLFVSLYQGKIHPFDGFAWAAMFRELAIKMGKEFQTEKGTFNMLRGHNFRKFFKTQLQNDGMAHWQVEHMMAHTMDALEKAYFIEDSDKMKENYIQHMDAVTITHEVRQVTIEQSEEFQKLKAQNAQLMQKMAQMEMSEEAIFDRMMKKFPALAQMASAD